MVGNYTRSKVTHHRQIPVLQCVNIDNMVGNKRRKVIHHLQIPGHKQNKKKNQGLLSLTESMKIAKETNILQKPHAILQRGRLIMDAASQHLSFFTIRMFESMNLLHGYNVLNQVLESFRFPNLSKYQVREPSSSLNVSFSIAIFCLNIFQIYHSLSLFKPKTRANALNPILHSHKEKKSLLNFFFLLHFFVPMEARAETCNAPQASSPPHRLEMSMSVLPDGTCVYRHVVPPVPAAVTGGSGGAHPVSLSEFKKWGRPRKCELFDYVPVGVTACSSSTTRVPSPLPDGSVDGAGPVGIVSPVVAIAALGSKENTFTPYIIDIKAGQDILSILSLFREKGHVCVLSANGVVSQAVLHQAESSVAVSYEGRFEILLLSGLLPKSNDACREIALSVMLAGINGKVFGGRLAGLLIAASPVQLVIGCFASDWHEEPSIGAKRVKITSPVNPSRNQLDVSRIPYEQKRE